MKTLITLFSFVFGTPSFANLYLQTEYQEGRRPIITTKQHIFLDKREVINYTKRSYVLLLKKITGDEAKIESESYTIDKIGHKTMIGGSYGTYRVGKSFIIADHGYKFKVTLEKIVPTKP